MSAVAIPAVRDEQGLRVLVGRRHPRSSFLGGFFAFPGGAHEKDDGPILADGDDANDATLRRTAARELEEETGLRGDAARLLFAGTRVTPPFGPRRFHSRMYLDPRDAAEEPAPADPGELLEMHWVRPADLMERWRSLDVRIAPPLIPMLQEMESAGDEPFEGIAARLHALNGRMEAEGPHIEFVPDVLTLLVKTPTLPPATHTNCYVVGSKELLILDPGSGDPLERARVASLVRRRRAEGARAVAIVLTHHHGDHVGGAAALAAELELPVWAHEGTWERWGEGGSVRRREGSRALADGDVLELAGGEVFDVMHTPGHAAGHLALLERRHGSLFSGDLVSGVSTILVDSAPGSMDAYLASLARIRDAGARTLFPGHGFPFIAPAKGVQRVIDHRLDREERIAAALADGPLDLAALVRRAYSDTPEANPALAAAQAECHLERLERAGRVRRAGGRWEVAR